MANMSKVQTEEDFEELVENPEGLGFEVMEKKYIDSSRWTEIWNIVWTEDEGKTFFSYSYEIPSTEYQEGSEMDFDPSQILEVTPQEKTIIEYIAKK